MPSTPPTHEQRFARIEAALQAVAESQRNTQEIQRTLLDSQRNNQSALRDVLESQLNLQGLQRKLIEAQTKTEQTIESMAASVVKYIDTADARMKRIEENLDGLIRAITAEHGNGHTKSKTQR
jgi:hypothetical protein